MVLLPFLYLVLQDTNIFIYFVLSEKYINTHLPLFLGGVTNYRHVPSISQDIQLNQWSKNMNHGVPVMPQWLTNPTRNHEIAGLIPGLAQWVKDLALP